MIYSEWSIIGVVMRSVAISPRYCHQPPLDSVNNAYLKGKTDTTKISVSHISLDFLRGIKKMTQ